MWTEVIYRMRELCKIVIIPFLLSLRILEEPLPEEGEDVTTFARESALVMTAVRIHVHPSYVWLFNS